MRRICKKFKFTFSFLQINNMLINNLRLFADEEWNQGCVYLPEFTELLMWVAPALQSRLTP